VVLDRVRVAHAAKGEVWRWIKNESVAWLWCRRSIAEGRAKGFATAVHGGGKGASSASNARQPKAINEGLALSQRRDTSWGS
jgi:hypothetical protein